MSRETRLTSSKWIAVAVTSVVTTMQMPKAALAADPAANSQPGAVTQMEIRNEQLQQKLDALQQQVTGLTQQINDVHREQLKAMDDAVLLDIQRNDELPGNVSVGYDDGFFIKQGDDFKLKANALLDYRYTFAADRDLDGPPSSTLGRKVGNFSGFSLTNAQIAISGYAFQNFIFKMMGNFGGITTFNSTLPTDPPSAPAQGTFQVNELWGGYSFSPQLNIRGGSLVAPFIPERTLANYGGNTLPDLSDAQNPFSPGYQLGADVYGQLLDKTLSYDVLFGDGSNSQDDVDSAVPAAGRDNRFGVYNREQFAGSGKLADFLDEQDLQNHSNFVWILGLGEGFESQNAASSYDYQTGTKIQGISEPSGTPGFVAPTSLDGNVYRLALDLRTKWEGWATFSQVLYQNINNQGATPIVDGKSNINQFGWFVQSGYFLVPSKWEVAGRISEVATGNGLNHTMDIYELGVNYYVFNENFKIQVAEKYVPRNAGFTDSFGTELNTSDAITEVQLQGKF